MKNLIIFIGLFLLVIVMSCTKQQTDFRDLFNGHEVVYTGSVDHVIDRPGNLRTMLKWKSSADPSIVKYVILWNNNRDSQVVNITNKTDSVFATITNLQEFVYTFTIFSYDAKGNKSIAKVVNGVKVYGPVYKAGLLNRAYNADVPYVRNDDGSVELNFNRPDTVNTNTKVKYTSTADIVKEVDFAPSDSILKLPDYKFGTEILYKSFYMPTSKALDVFEVNNYSTYPPYVFKDVMCKKSLFKEYNLPNDVGTLDECPISKLWDGSVDPQGYPNIFHSRDNITLPHTITFDMGKIYTNLTTVEETGRNCCHNPDQFEVWGIADITNAATTLPASDPGWKAEAISKGWTLLVDAVRNDDGNAPKKFTLITNPPPVRYIRMRIKHTTNGETRQSNMSEITFWNYQ